MKKTTQLLEQASRIICDLQRDNDALRAELAVLDSIKAMLSIKPRLGPSNLAPFPDQVHEAILDEHLQGSWNELRREWGEKTQANIDRARCYARTLGINVNDPAIGNNAAIIKALYRAAPRKRTKAS